MAKNNQPIAKRCKALGISPAVMGYNKKNTTRNSSEKPKKKGEYALQLQEKQKAKFIYGVLEKQFHNYYLKAEKMAGKTGENLLSLLERRLDNVVFRMGLANTRREARLLVSHAHYTVNGKKVDIPSILVNVGDVIAVKDSSRSTDKFKSLIEGMDSVIAPKWLELDKTNGTAKVIALPTREDIDFPFEEQLIVELYSK
ncbi:MAG: 30S ribosomal protein S4 [Candidatus Flemingiibacterium sp.]